MPQSLSISQMYALFNVLDLKVNGDLIIPFIDESQEAGNQNLATTLSLLLNYQNQSLIINLDVTNNDIQIPNNVGVIAIETTQTAPVPTIINMPSEPVADSLLTFLSNELLGVTFATNLPNLIFNGAPSTISPTSPITFQFIENSGWWAR